MRNSITLLIIIALLIAGCSSNQSNQEAGDSTVETSSVTKDIGNEIVDKAVEEERYGTNLPNLTVDNPFLKSEESVTPIVEWDASMQDTKAVLPLIFGSQKATLYMGRDNPNGMKFLVVFDGEEYAVSLPIEETLDSSLLEGVEFGEMSIQTAAIDLDRDGTLEIIVVTSDELVEGGVWVFSYTEVANKAKVNPFHQEMFEHTQGEVFIEGNKIMIPYGGQGLYEEYLYTADGVYSRNN